MTNKYEQFSKVDEWQLNRRCRNKARYDSKQEAYQKGQDTYQCEFCHKWHRTKAPRVRKRKLK